jgi:hypothetical protein
MRERTAHKEDFMETVLSIILAIVTILSPGTVLAQQKPVWDGHSGSQCCECCEMGTVVGRERQCVITTTDRCRARGWGCYGYVLCPK